jgi:hypothetical protein
MHLESAKKIVQFNRISIAHSERIVLRLLFMQISFQFLRLFEKAFPLLIRAAKLLWPACRHPPREALPVAGPNLANTQAHRVREKYS